MAGLTTRKLVKRFGPIAAVDRVDLDLADGEFVAVLGPSGCGKTTLLRLIAGFEIPDDGEIVIGDRSVNDGARHVPPEERRIGIVFQSYALWPHMDVRRNVGYALEVAGVGGGEYDRRVKAALASVGLEGMGARRPAQLSGGQRQRVALARCLVMEPALVLLDEPLANLDVHLRAAMLDEFRAFHDKTGATMVYITHDQSEAMALADRVAVMDSGRLAQLADPRTLYREPATAMVGAFVGQGTIVPAGIAAVNGGTAEADIFGVRTRLRCRPDQRPGSGQACLRPEDVSLASAAEPGALAARVSRATYKGGHVEVEAAPLGGGAAIRVSVPDHRPPRAGDEIWLRLGGGWVIPNPHPVSATTG